MRWRWLLQQALGGLQRIPSADARIIKSREGKGGLGLTAQYFQDLLSGRSPLLVCRGAVPPDDCKRAAERLETLAKGGSTNLTGKAVEFAHWYLGLDPAAPASDYTKLGYTKTDVLREEGVRMAAGRAAPERYLQRAAQTRRFLQDEVFQGGVQPIDWIEEELSALPGVSCCSEKCPETGRDFLPCVIRRMTPGGRRTDGNLHMDTVIPGRNLSVNVYLRTPTSTDENGGCTGTGGELVLFPLRKDSLSRVLNSHFFMTLEVQNFFPNRRFYTDELLASSGIEPIVYQPAAGDVVFLDPAYPHAVRDFEAEQSRLSLQTFIQIRTSGRGREQVLEYAV